MEPASQQPTSPERRGVGARGAPQRHPHDRRGDRARANGRTSQIIDGRQSPTEQKNQTPYQHQAPGKVKVTYQSHVPKGFGDHDNAGREKQPVFTANYRGAPQLTGEEILESAREQRQPNRTEPATFSPRTEDELEAELAQQGAYGKQSIEVKNKPKDSKLLKIVRRRRVIRVSWMVFGLIGIFWLPMLAGWAMFIFGFALDLSVTFLIDSVTNLVSSTFLTSWLTRPLEWLSSVLKAPGFSIMMVGYGITTVFGILTIAITWGIYTLFRINSLGGPKVFYFLCSVVLAMLPFVNLFPWVLLWVVSVIVYQNGNVRK